MMDRYSRMDRLVNIDRLYYEEDILSAMAK